MSAIAVSGRRLFNTTLVAGCVAAVVEMVFVLPIQAALGASPRDVFQSIASALIGKAAFQGGAWSMAVGVVLHLLVSIVAAAVFVVAAQRWSILLRKPVLSGIAFGVVVYLVMNFVVIPLTAMGFSFPTSPGLWSMSFSVHLFAFGLPIALVARWMMLPRGAKV